MDQLDSIYTLVCYIGAGTEFACRAYRRVRRVLYVLGWAPLCSVRARLCQLARTLRWPKEGRPTESLREGGER